MGINESIKPNTTQAYFQNTANCVFYLNSLMFLKTRFH
jgi:hypothetical protein